MKLTSPTAENLSRAASLLCEGGLVAFPTETVYGLGANAADATAVARIFAAKGRPADHPLIVHLGSAEEMAFWARDIPQSAWIVAKHCWPGPLTLILKRAHGVLDAVTGGQDTIGLRVPDHPVALALLQAFGGGVAAPSANRFGRVSPTTAAHVFAELGDTLDCIIDGGACEVGLESTILDLSSNRPRILRPGAIMPSMLQDLVGELLTADSSAGPRVPGSLASHYAPTTPVSLIDPIRLDSLAQAALVAGRAVAVMARRPAPDPRYKYWQCMPAQAEDYGRQLYALLRQIDTWGCSEILIELPPASMAWTAVQDRLQRAAGGLHSVRDLP